MSVQAFLPLNTAAMPPRTRAAAAPDCDENPDYESDLATELSDAEREDFQARTEPAATPKLTNQGKGRGKGKMKEEYKPRKGPSQGIMTTMHIRSVLGKPEPEQFCESLRSPSLTTSHSRSEEQKNRL